METVEGGVVVAMSSFGMACFGSGGGFAVLTVGAVLFVVSVVAWRTPIMAFYKAPTHLQTLKQNI